MGDCYEEKCPAPATIPIHGTYDALLVCPHDCPRDECGSHHHVGSNGELRLRVGPHHPLNVRGKRRMLRVKDGGEQDA